jgi:hypothetical protein
MLFPDAFHDGFNETIFDVVDVGAFYSLGQS